MNKLVKEIISNVIYIAIVALITLLLITYVIQRTNVDGASMEPYLHHGDSLMIDKLSYRFKSPERFDIIVFDYKMEPSIKYIKRIIGLPGETVSIERDGTIYIDGQELLEGYGKEVIQESKLGNVSFPIQLGEDEYFVLGDNRNNSSDSRISAVGNIHKSDIVGKAWIRIWPLKDFGLISHQ